MENGEKSRWDRERKEAKDRIDIQKKYKEGRKKGKKGKNKSERNKLNRRRNFVSEKKLLREGKEEQKKKRGGGRIRERLKSQEVMRKTKKENYEKWIDLRERIERKWRGWRW